MGISVWAGYPGADWGFSTALSALLARSVEAQTEMSLVPTLVTNAVVTWTTEYYGLAVESMRRWTPH